MANSHTSDSIELLVMRTLGAGVHDHRVRASILGGSFASYLEAEKLRKEVAYESNVDFGYDYLVCSLLSKWKGWTDTGIDLESVALDSWTAAELKCQMTNRRLRELRLRGKDPRAWTFISEVQRKISLVLGRLSLTKTLGRVRWSNGATAFTRRGATVHQKMSVPIAVTQSALKYLANEIEHDPVWSHAILGVRPSGPYRLLRSNFQVTEDNRWMTVPKNAKTHRCIAAEPAGNAFLQQGVGRYIRDRLKRFGVDLDDQSINQHAAADAVRAGLSTLDLQAASDTISRELIWLLLPINWATLLDDLRSSYSLLPGGKRVHLEKFSSMGNAFTFELESLIFWAIAKTASEIATPDSSAQVYVYGDDLIVPRGAYDATIDWLTFFGFTVNTEKSFKDGPFFESCGVHYHSGGEVTPVYQKEVCTSNPELIRFANRLERWRMKHEYELSDDRMHALIVSIAMIAQCYHGKLPLIPESSESDDGFLVSRFELPGPFDPNRGHKCRVLRWVPEVLSDDSIVVDQFGIARLSSLYYASLKLRDPDQSYTNRQGRVVKTVGGAWIQMEVWIHS